MTVTANDMVWRMTLYLGGNANASAQREIRVAISDAYRELVDDFAWRCMHKFYIFPTSASITTGTVSYDHSGGSSERLWTFSSSVVPSWADRGYIFDGTNSWPISRYLSSTTVQSPSDVNPGADVASTTYELYQNEYLLPEDFVAAGCGMEESAGYALSTGPSEITWLNRQNPSSGPIGVYTIVRDRHLPGRLAIAIDRWPSTSVTLAFLYRRRPRKLKYFGTNARERQGTVTLSGVTVSGDGTAFESDMVGSVIRISSNATATPDDDLGDNPYAFEGVIEAVSSASSLTVRSNPNSTSLTSKKYVIADPIDIRDTMLNAFQCCCEKNVERLRQREGAGKGDAIAIYQQALRTAKQADRTSFDIQSLIPDWSVSISELERQKLATSDP